MNKEGREIWIPDKSKEGEMYLHGDAPGLEEALQRTAYKRLTIALPSNYPSEFIQQRYTRYTATARHWTVEDKEAHEKMGFHEGWNMAADQLEALAKSL